MTETSEKICFRFSILHTCDCDTLKNNDKKKLGRLSHTSVNGKFGVSVISLQSLVFSRSKEVKFEDLLRLVVVMMYM